MRDRRRPPLIAGVACVVTLAEDGDALGLTRQRAQQIVAGALDRAGRKLIARLGEDVARNLARDEPRSPPIRGR